MYLKNLKYDNEYMETKTIKEVMMDAANVMEKETHLLEGQEDGEPISYAAIDVATMRHKERERLNPYGDAPSRIKLAIVVAIKALCGYRSELVDEYIHQPNEALHDAIVTEFENNPKISNKEIAANLRVAVEFI